MKICVIIPARYNSQRFMGKPLCNLTSSKGRTQPLLKWTWDKAQCARDQAEIWIATDNSEIYAAANDFGANVMMTPESCKNGTERCAHAAKRLGLQDQDVVINLQGDAPLMPVPYINSLLMVMEQQVADVTTIVVPTSRQVRNSVYAVIDAKGYAMYFSRFTLTPRKGSESLHHLGIYGYRVSALKRYLEFPEGEYEHAERLEQLRWLEHRFPVGCLIAPPLNSADPVPAELNTPGDIRRVERYL